MTNKCEKVFTLIAKQIQIKELFLVRLENKKEEK